MSLYPVPSGCPFISEEILKYFILLVVLQAQRAFYSLDRVWVQISTDIIHQNNEKKGNICASAVCDLINVSH